MKKFLLLIIVIILIISGVWYYKKQTKPTNLPVIATFVKTTSVRKDTLPTTINAIGMLTAKSVNVSPEIPGHVKRVLFEDGSNVEKGQSLVKLDDLLFKTKLDSAKAQLLYSENNYKRMLSLGEKGAISKQAIEQAKADLIEKKALMQESEVSYKKMELLAPFSGKVAKSQVSKGDYVNVGQNLVTITDTKSLRVEYSLPEKYLPALKVGQIIKFQTSAYPDKTFTARLKFISPSINTDNHAILMYAEFDNHEGLLAPGMFVNIIQTLNSNEEVLLIPAKSLVPVLDNVEVFKVVDGKAIATTILLGRRTKSEVQVLSGLNKNDIVITDGQLKVRNGDPVQIES